MEGASKERWVEEFVCSSRDATRLSTPFLKGVPLLGYQTACPVAHYVKKKHDCIRAHAVLNIWHNFSCYPSSTLR